MPANLLQHQTFPLIHQKDVCHNGQNVFSNMISFVCHYLFLYLNNHFVQVFDISLHKLFQSYPILFGMIGLVQGYNLSFDNIHYLKSLNNRSFSDFLRMLYYYNEEIKNIFTSNFLLSFR